MTAQVKVHYPETTLVRSRQAFTGEARGSTCSSGSSISAITSRWTLREEITANRNVEAQSIAQLRNSVQQAEAARARNEAPACLGGRHKPNAQPRCQNRAGQRSNRVTPIATISGAAAGDPTEAVQGGHCRPAAVHSPRRHIQQVVDAVQWCNTKAMSRSAALITADATNGTRWSRSLRPTLHRVWV